MEFVMNRKLISIAAALLAAAASASALVSADDNLLISQKPVEDVNLISANPDSADSTEQTETITFSDIPDDAPYKDAVYKLVENGVLNGYLDGTFRPYANLTRAEMCKMINLTFGYTDTEGVEGFPDLVENEWYVPYVLAAVKAGYILGDAEGTFRPDDNISREEVCAILYRIIKPYDLDIPTVINDPVSDWARPYVEALVKNALMPLEDGGTFRATEPIKRHELASAVAPHSYIKVDDITCTVTLMNGENVQQTLQAVIGKSLDTLPEPSAVPEGYKFAGWSKAKDELVLVDTSYVFVENTTLYAYFEKCEYTVKFMADSTTLVSAAAVKYKEFAVKPVNPQKSGYSFEGWSVDGKTAVDVEKYEITADTTFTALFEKQSSGGAGGGSSSGGSGGSSGGGSGGGSGSGSVVITYKVYFYVDGEQYGSAQLVTKGKAPKAPDKPELDGYTFLYWSYEENGERVNLDDAKITKDNTKFYAVFALDDENPNDPEIIEALKKASKQFSAMRLSDSIQKQIRTIVIDTIELVLADAENGEYIDSDYVSDNYNEQLKKVEKMLNEDMTKAERSDFISRVSNSVDEETFNILADFFLNEETKDDYLG